MPDVSLDPRFEALFQRWSLRYEVVPELSLTDQLRVLDAAQVRELDHIATPDRVSEYARQMKTGAVFPPLVLWSPDILIDGNTRARAAQQIGRVSFPAYRVELPHIDMAIMLAAALNQLGGARLTVEEASKAALIMMSNGIADEAIARELGQQADAVRRWRRESEFRERSARLDLAPWATKLTKKQRQDLAKITHDGPFAELVKLVADAKPDANDLKELSQTVETAPTDEDAVASITQARESWVPTGPPPQRVIRNKVAQQARMHLGALIKALANPAAAYDPGNAEKDLLRVEEAIELLQAVRALYQQQERAA